MNALHARVFELMGGTTKQSNHFRYLFLFFGMTTPQRGPARVFVLPELLHFF